MSAASSRPAQLPVIDVLRALAAQLIVLHHLAFYGPMSDHAMALAPGLIGWLWSDARMAVQVFLVIGGFLAARSLAPQGRLCTDAPLATLARRYLRLTLPFAAALALAVFCTVLATLIEGRPARTALPDPLQVAAHLLLLQDVLGVEALTAGAWYVAMDFQLFAALLLVLWLAGRPALAGRRTPALLLTGLLGAASLLHFNRDAAWDAWAPYFFGAYALGAMSGWASVDARVRATWVLLMLVAALALVIDFRERVLVAVVTAAILYWSTSAGAARYGERLLRRPLLDRASRIAYSVFLVHYPVCLVINAAFGAWVPAEPGLHLLGMGLAWAASVAVGAAFHRAVEQPALRWAGSLVPARDAARRPSA